MQTQAADTREDDVPYLRMDNLELLARIYRPAGRGPFPGVVEIHGGAWTANDRFANAAIGRALAANGIVVMSIDFRMPPLATYPASIRDLNVAIRWLKINAARFDVDPAKVGALGTSSGGHQMLLTALRPDDPDFAATPLAGADAKLRFAVACWPIADPLKRYRMAQQRGLARLVANHDAYFGGEDLMQIGNPQLVLERGEQTDLPPLQIIQGTNDDNVTEDMADCLASAWRSRGGHAELELYPGEPHTFISKDPTSAASRAALARIVAFVHQQTR